MTAAVIIAILSPIVLYLSKLQEKRWERLDGEK